MLRIGITEFGGAIDPLRADRRVLPHAAPLDRHHADIVGGLRIALVGGALVPLVGGGFVALDADALLVHHAEIVLGQRIAGRRQRLKPAEGERIVAGLEGGDGIVERVGGSRRGAAEGQPGTETGDGKQAAERRETEGQPHGLETFWRFGSGGHWRGPGFFRCAACASLAQ